MKALRALTLGITATILFAACGCSSDALEHEKVRAQCEVRDVDLRICFLLRELAEAGQYPTNLAELETALTDLDRKKQVKALRDPKGYGYLLVDTLTFKAEAVGNGGVRTRYEANVKLEADPSIHTLVMVREYPSSTEGAKDTVIFE